MEDRDATSSTIPPHPSSRKDFRIAIICALPLEIEMVELVLDIDWTQHSGTKYGKAAGDKNTYTTGVIAGHNVVLAYMPGIGGNDIAAVAARLQYSFTSVEFVFVVGICGAVPIHPKTQEEIVLGDCIISTAVVQYDFGRLGPQGFERKRSLDSLGRANPEIRAMTAKWTTRRNRQHLINKLQQYLEDLLEEEPSIQYPGIERDLLFDPSYLHEHRPKIGTCNKCQIETGICSMDCELLGCSKTYLIERKRPCGTQPRIHFGCFGSANTVLKSGLHRDAISNNDQIVGFEMEGSGAWDILPTIVIKSVCDYADSHKNKLWQEYAAAAAAACLKAVLGKVELSDMEVGYSGRLPWILPLLIAFADLEILLDSCVPQYQPKMTLDEKESKCLQVFCLQPAYRDAKDRIPERVQGTCRWVLSQEAYQRWITTPGHCLLVSADPGCGKSVLARHLIDHELKEKSENTHICYYFFKDQIQNKLTPALCAILHQLLSAETELLITHALPKYQSFGESITKNLGVLSDLIYDTINNSRSRIVLILDGLDECEETDCGKLFALLFRLKGLANLNILLTSRPYDMIVSEYNEEAISSRLHIPGEQESDTISREINLVIRYRLQDLYLRKRLSLQLRQELEHRLLSESHRTYLWVHLVFDELGKGLKKTPKEMLVFFKNLPRTVNEAYEKILNRFTDDGAIRDIVARVLSMMIAAEEPLTTRQMQVAVKIQLDTPMSLLSDIDMEPDDDFIIKLRNYCGLFIQIYNDKVTFIHQTAREFLLANTTPCEPMNSSPTLWHGSVTLESSHRLAARICLAYLQMSGQENDLGWLGTDKFTTYAARRWDTHFIEGHCMNDEALRKAAFFILDPDHNVSHVWRLYRQADDTLGASTWRPNQCVCTGPSPHIALAASLRTDSFLRLCLSNQIWDQTEFCAAIRATIRFGRLLSLNLLLKYAKKHGISLKKYGILTRSPLYEAIQISSSVETVRLLLENGSDPNEIFASGWTPMTIAVDRAWTDLIHLLLEYKGEINLCTMDRSDLDETVHQLRGTDSVSRSVTHFIDKNRDWYPYTKHLSYCLPPLHRAVLSDNRSIAELLLAYGAKVDAEDQGGFTPLHLAIIGRQAWYGNILSLLLQYRADIEHRDRFGRTPLIQAVYHRKPAIILLLLSNDADPWAQDKYGRTSLHYAIEKQKYDFLDEQGYVYTAKAKNWREDIVHTLLRHGSHGWHEDMNGQTALHYAICYNNNASEIIRLLVLDGFNLDDFDDQCWTPLHWAVFRGIDSDIALLLELGADQNVQDDRGRTPLHYASWLMQEEVVQLLLDYGADPTLKDADGVSSEQVMLIMSRAVVYGRVHNRIKSRKSISDLKPQHPSTAKGNPQTLLANRARRKSI